MSIKYFLITFPFYKHGYHSVYLSGLTTTILLTQPIRGTIKSQEGLVFTGIGAVSPNLNRTYCVV